MAGRSVYSVTAIDFEADFIMEPSELIVVIYTCNSLLGGATWTDGAVPSANFVSDVASYTFT